MGSIDLQMIANRMDNFVGCLAAFAASFAAFNPNRNYLLIYSYLRDPTNVWCLFMFAITCAVIYKYISNSYLT